MEVVSFYSIYEATKTAQVEWMFVPSLNWDIDAYDVHGNKIIPAVVDVALANFHGFVLYMVRWSMVNPEQVGHELGIIPQISVKTDEENDPPTRELWNTAFEIFVQRVAKKKEEIGGNEPEAGITVNEG